MLQSVLKSRVRLASTAVVGLLIVAAIVWGVNSLAGASPALADDDALFFSFVAVTGAGPTDGTVPLMGMNGAGLFDPDTGAAAGGGTFEIFDGGAPGLPKPSLRSAKWEAKRVIKWTPCTPPGTCTTPGGDTTFGHITPGVVELEVDVKLDSGPKLKGLVLRLICNIGFAGIINKDPGTGDPFPEGYFITIPDPDLGTLEFKPLSPIVGITHIGRDPGLDFEVDGDDDHDDDDDDDDDD